MQRSPDSPGPAHAPAKPPPRYCPRCQTSFPPAEEPSTCTNCGEALVPKGYCPVCEDFWLLPAGTFCPKHDLPLDEREPPDPLLAADSAPIRWTTVARFSDSQSAEPPRIRLEAEGIPTFVDGQRMGLRSMYHVATNGVSLMVPDTLAHEARIILSQTWSATTALLDIDDRYDDDEDMDDGSKTAAEAEPELASEGSTRDLRPILVLTTLGLILAYQLLRAFF